MPRFERPSTAGRANLFLYVASKLAGSLIGQFLLFGDRFLMTDRRTADTVIAIRQQFRT